MDLYGFIDAYKEENSKIVLKIPTKSIADAVRMIDAGRKRGNHVFVIGNGGSASTASHFTSDLFKWAAGDGRQPIKALCLTDNVPLVSALTNDDGWSEIFIAQLRSLARPGDIIIAFSVHGGSGGEKAGAWSQNATKAIDYMRRIGGHSIGITGFDGGAMRDLCDVHINVPADSTPHVEALHVSVGHVIADALKELALHEHEQQTKERLTHRA